MLFGGLAGLFSAMVAWALFWQHYERQQGELVETGMHLGTAFDHEMVLRAHSIQSMKFMAEQFVDGRSSLAWNPLVKLVPAPDKGGYAMDRSAEAAQPPLGNATGLGPIPAPDSRAGREMAMAVALTPQFRSIVSRDPDTPWVYYTSAENFIYMYPYVSADEFFFSQKLFSVPFYSGATPSANPERRVVWTPVYLDEAGKGFMATVSVPLYQGDAFRGVISIDISLEKLSWLLDRYTFRNSQSHLVAADGQILVRPDGMPAGVLPGQLPSGVPVLVGDTFVTVFPLRTADWCVVITTPRWAWAAEAFKASAPFGLVVILLCACLILVSLLLKTLRTVRDLSIHDALTGLFNRRLFDSMAENEFAQALRNKSQAGLVVVDVDYFKKFNDTYGHQEGDKVLKAIAAALRATLRRATDRAFRIGGEEFAVLVSTTAPEHLEDMALRLCQAVRDLKIPHEQSPVGFVTISIGAVAVHSDQWMSYEQAYRLADRALYQAKAAGRDRVCMAGPEPLAA